MGPIPTTKRYDSNPSHPQLESLHYKCQTKSAEDHPTIIPIAHAIAVDVQATPVDVVSYESSGSNDARSLTGAWSFLTNPSEALSSSVKKKSWWRCATVALLCALLMGLASALGCSLRWTCFRSEDDPSRAVLTADTPELRTNSPSSSPTTASLPATEPVSASTTTTTTPMLHNRIRLRASDASPGDRFGISVSIVDDWMAVGAYRRAAANTTGSVYLYQRSRGVWQEIEQKLVPENDGEASNMRFGRSVALARNGGRTLVVGAYYDDHAGPFAGSAYVYSRMDDGTWVEEAKLRANDASADSLFGTEVAILGDDMVFVAAKNEDEKTGSVYLFERSAGGSFSQRQKIRSDSASPGSRFGSSIAVTENILVVGAEKGDTNEIDSGSAYVFTRTESGVWVQHQELLGSDSIFGDFFGFSVAVHDDMIAVGAIGDADRGSDSGSTIIFRKRNSGVWEEQQKLIASTSATNAKHFGYSLALDDEHLVVGTKIGVDGSSSGTGYAYEWDTLTETWVEAFTLGSDGAKGTDLTPRIALHGDTIAVGSGYSDTTDGRDAGELFIYRF